MSVAKTFTQDQTRHAGRGGRDETHARTTSQFTASYLPATGITLGHTARDASTSPHVSVSSPGGLSPGPIEAALTLPPRSILRWSQPRSHRNGRGTRDAADGTRRTHGHVLTRAHARERKHATIFGHSLSRYAGHAPHARKPLSPAARPPAPSDHPCEKPRRIKTPKRLRYCVKPHSARAHRFSWIGTWIGSHAAKALRRRFACCPPSHL